VLDRSFSQSVNASVREQLQLVVFSLIGAADETEDASLEFPEGRLEPRLERPGSGLYARVWDETGALVWSSPSLTLGSRAGSSAKPSIDLGKLKPGVLVFKTPGRDFQALYPVIWESTGERRFIFEVRVDGASYRAQTTSFRRSLMLGLGAVVVLLMIVQGAAIAWSLRPVGVMATRVRAIEAGERERMGDDYPPELTGLASNIDRFIDHESGSRQRYQKAMEDLAHSLKTPIAVLRNALHGTDKLLTEQIDRMETTVAHQLSRARAARPALLSRPVRLKPICEQLLRALDKAYRDKGVRADLVVADDASARVDERDLMEMLGNLLENAYKYGRSRVRLSATRNHLVQGARAAIVIEDDGPGIPSEMRDMLGARGARLDEAVDGHGIGLAAAMDLAGSYGGRVEIGDSDLGGAKLTLELPL
jgi:two-component system sensor histidine kinase PhoQ